MFPVFFSVSSRDIAFAEQIWERFPDDWVYLYSKTGEVGVHMWDEISRTELPKSQIFVVFWSKNYTEASGCVREILQAKELIQKNHLQAVVLRLDDYSITWNEQMGEEDKPIFEALKSMLDYRTSAPLVGLGDAINIIQKVCEPILAADHPRLPRPDILQTLRDAIKMDRFNFHPAVWISGFNGVGRESLVRDFNRSFVPNGRGVLVEVDETALPKQVLLRLESAGLGSNLARLSILNSEIIDNEAAAVASVVEQIFSAGNYVIFKHSRIVEENVDLPQWLDDVVNALAPAKRPKLFIISQLPLTLERRKNCRDKLISQRIPTIAEYQLVDFCYQLIGYFDKNPNRWADSDIENVVRAAGGTIGFLVSLIRSAANIEDFDQIDRLVASDSSNMAASITVYVRWAFQQLRNLDDEQRTLLFLNDVSPCDINDIENVVAPGRSIIRVLGKLIELGVVEREGENLYRLAPLLANRLSRDLIRPDLLAWLRKALVEFLKKPFEVAESDNEYLKIESRIQASLMSEDDKVPANVVAFVSAAHWFRAGIRLYHARRREPAYRILKKAYTRRSEFNAASRVELIRYFCLSATNNRKYSEAEACIKLLDGVHSTKNMAAFLKGDMLEQQGKYVEAIREYENSIYLNEGRDSRLERTYRPLVRCILLSPRPDFALAEEYVNKWLDLRSSVFALMSRARVYLHWKYSGGAAQRDIPSNIDQLYSDALSELESDPGVGSSHFEIKSEEAELSGHFGDAMKYMDSAVEADRRFELKTQRWRLMARSGDVTVAEKVLEELEAARNNPDFRSDWLPFLPALADTYATAIKKVGRPYRHVNTFAPELSSEELGAIITRVKRKG